MQRQILQRYGVMVKVMELVLGFAVLVGVLVFAYSSVFALAGKDWQTTDAFYELIYRVLLMVIGLEFIRMLVTHDIVAVLELLAFVIARKMLRPDLVALDIVLAVLSFVALLAARRFLLDKEDLERTGYRKPDPGAPSPSSDTQAVPSLS